MPTKIGGNAGKREVENGMALIGVGCVRHHPYVVDVLNMSFLRFDLVLDLAPHALDAFAELAFGAAESVGEREVEIGVALVGAGGARDIDFAPVRQRQPDVDVDQPAAAVMLAEDKIGTMLPCNVIVQEAGEGQVGVAAVDPVASMMAIKNPKLASIAGDVRDMLKQMVEGL